MAAQMASRCDAEFILLTAVSVPQHMVLASTMDQRTIEGYVERMSQEAVGPAMDVLRRLKRGRRSEGGWWDRPRKSSWVRWKLWAWTCWSWGAKPLRAKDLILGSVSHRVARHARVPVLLVP